MKYDGTMNPETMAFVLDWLREVARTSHADALRSKHETIHSASCTAWGRAYEACADRLERAVQAERERTED